MILRTWTGFTRVAAADAYVDVIKATGVPGLRGTPGNQGVWILRRLNGEKAEFVVASLWDSLEHIRDFAGEDLTKAVYYPEDDPYLLEPRAERVSHYEIAFDSQAAPESPAFAPER